MCTQQGQTGWWPGGQPPGCFPVVSRKGSGVQVRQPPRGDVKMSKCHPVLTNFFQNENRESRKKKSRIWVESFEPLLTDRQELDFCQFLLQTSCGCRQHGQHLGCATRCELRLWERPNVPAKPPRGITGCSRALLESWGTTPGCTIFCLAQRGTRAVADSPPARCPSSPSHPPSPPRPNPAPAAPL